MQFMPATWRMYGVDANKDGKRDPYNPVDAIFAAARYLKAAGGDRDIRTGIFAYNRSEEHTSELQSPCNLVCRLLLEKKKLHFPRIVAINSLQTVLCTHCYVAESDRCCETHLCHGDHAIPGPRHAQQLLEGMLHHCLY